MTAGVDWRWVEGKMCADPGVWTPNGASGSIFYHSIIGCCNVSRLWWNINFQIEWSVCFTFWCMPIGVLAAGWAHSQNHSTHTHTQIISIQQNSACADGGPRYWLYTLDHPLGPPSTPAKLFRRTWTQPLRSHTQSFGTLGKLLNFQIIQKIVDKSFCCNAHPNP